MHLVEFQHFQFISVRTAEQQAQTAALTALETKLQVAIAERTQQQNSSILVFTIIATVFLPLSFFTSYFGMNTAEIRGITMMQGSFWSYSGPISAAVVITVLAFAFRQKLGQIAGLWGTQTLENDLEAGRKKKKK